VGAGGREQGSLGKETLFQAPFNLCGEPSVPGDVITVYRIAD
jgi:hypothetical protein